MLRRERREQDAVDVASAALSAAIKDKTSDPPPSTPAPADQSADGDLSYIPITMNGQRLKIGIEKGTPLHKQI